jgi:NTP pyrophosphatase (non-canonical NTP hydrolase)
MTSLELQHLQMVQALTKPGKDIVTSLTPEKAHLLHMVVGIAGEVGELLDAVKKHVIYNKALDLENVVEELGDIEFYLAGLRLGLGITRPMTLQQNQTKLAERYNQNVYIDAAAQERADKKVE